MNVLAIGNSFSQDAGRYMSQIAKADSQTLNFVNLYIGGCPLYLHHRNMLADERNYGLEVNGMSTGFGVSIKEALLNRQWDYISLQQVSHFSVNYDTYQPYLNKLAEYIRNYAPKSKLLIHQTWAYEEGSDRLCKELGYKKQSEMYDDLKKAYEKAAGDIDAYKIIPSGTAFQNLISNGIEHIHRDTFHASFGKGRYTLGLLWYKMLFGNSVLNNSFSDFDEEVSKEDIATIKEIIEKIN